MDDMLFLDCRARVLADLAAGSRATPDAVSALEDALESRRWWVGQWPAGSSYVAGLVAQDVQDALLEQAGRWPLCPLCDGTDHALHIHPELGGPDPVWVCERRGATVAGLGGLSDGS